MTALPGLSYEERLLRPPKTSDKGWAEKRLSYFRLGPDSLYSLKNNATAQLVLPKEILLKRSEWG